MALENLSSNQPMEAKLDVIESQPDGKNVTKDVAVKEIENGLNVPSANEQDHTKDSKALKHEEIESEGSKVLEHEEKEPDKGITEISNSSKAGEVSQVNEHESSKEDANAVNSDESDIELVPKAEEHGKASIKESREMNYEETNSKEPEILESRPEPTSESTQLPNTAEENNKTEETGIPEAIKEETPLKENSAEPQLAKDEASEGVKESDIETKVDPGPEDLKLPIAVVKDQESKETGIVEAINEEISQKENSAESDLAEDAESQNIKEPEIEEIKEEQLPVEEEKQTQQTSSEADDIKNKVIEIPVEAPLDASKVQHEPQITTIEDIQKVSKDEDGIQESSDEIVIAKDQSMDDTIESLVEKEQNVADSGDKIPIAKEQGVADSSDESSIAKQQNLVDTNESLAAKEITVVDTSEKSEAKETDINVPFNQETEEDKSVISDKKESYSSIENISLVEAATGEVEISEAKKHSATDPNESSVVKKQSIVDSSERSIAEGHNVPGPSEDNAVPMQDIFYDSNESLMEKEMPFVDAKESQEARGKDVEAPLNQELKVENSVISEKKESVPSLVSVSSIEEATREVEITKEQLLDLPSEVKESGASPKQEYTEFTESKLAKDRESDLKIEHKVTEDRSVEAQMPKPEIVESKLQEDNITSKEEVMEEKGVVSNGMEENASRDIQPSAVDVENRSVKIEEVSETIVKELPKQENVSIEEPTSKSNDENVSEQKPEKEAVPNSSVEKEVQNLTVAKEEQKDVVVSRGVQFLITPSQKPDEEPQSPKVPIEIKEKEKPVAHKSDNFLQNVRTKALQFIKRLKNSIKEKASCGKRTDVSSPRAQKDVESTPLAA